MTICPHCKSAILDESAPCPRCGKQASAPPARETASAPPAREAAPSTGDFDLGGGLDLARGGSMSSGGGGASAYSGGGLSMGDDEDPFADHAGGGALELDMGPAARAAPGPKGALAPSVPPANAVSQAPAPTVSQPPTPAQPMPPSPPVAIGPASVSGPRTPDPASLIARFPEPPASALQTPMYALKVLLRKLELQQDLESLRRRRSPDVPLYQRALNTHDARAYRTGLAIVLVLCTVATLLFFTPVFLRFLRAD